MIEFKRVSKTYGSKTALKNINLVINDGEFVCLIGTSGSGKTTCMRMINRMIKQSEGDIMIDGQNIKDVNEVVLRRSIGYVIQQIGLMPHMTLYENITMVCKLLKWPEKKMRETAEGLMKRVDLPLELLESYPSELSGGMQQRVGVIRALAADQQIVLMDEPFGALDPITRESLQQLIKQIQQDMKKTVVFVTHDMDEALALADKIVVMDKGEIIQMGTPKEIITAPANDFVRNLVGEERLNQAIFEYESVEKIMKTPISISIEASVPRAAAMMSRTRVDDMLVVDQQQHLVGRIDLFTLSSRQNASKKVEDVMKRVTSLPVNTTIRDAIYYIKDLGYRNMPIVDHENKLVGIITRASIVSAMYDAFWSNYEPESAEEAETVLESRPEQDQVVSDD